MALSCAVALVGAAGVVLVVDDPSDPALDAGAGVTPSVIAPTPTLAASTSAASPTPTPTASVTVSVPAGPAPLTVDAARGVVPQAGEEFVAAEVPVELSSVCEGAGLDLTAATPLHASLQSSGAPLRFVDVTVAVHSTPEAATAAYDRLAADVAACPPSRTATPAPAPGEAAAAVILVEGERRDVAVLGQPAVQWVQVQTVESPATQLRTTVTLTRIQNVLLLVSVDADSETAEADDIAADSLARAESVASALAGLVA